MSIMSFYKCNQPPGGRQPTLVFLSHSNDTTNTANANNAQNVHAQRVYFPPTIKPQTKNNSMRKTVTVAITNTPTAQAPSCPTKASVIANNATGKIRGAQATEQTKHHIPAKGLFNRCPVLPDDSSCTTSSQPPYFPYAL